MPGNKLKPEHLPNNIASGEDICQAIEALSKVDHYRIRKAADSYVRGTEYQDAEEIIQEAIMRTMLGANGENGRHWPKNVPFIAYLIQTIQGLADDSQNSAFRRKTDYLEIMATEDAGAEDALGRLGHHKSDVVTQAIEMEEEDDTHNRAEADAAEIEAHFAGDPDVTWIIMGHKDGYSAAEIREMGEMTDTQYATARRRFRRGIEKLFPGRRKT